MKDRKKPEKFWLPHGMPSDDREFAFSSRVFPKASQIKALYKLWHYQNNTFGLPCGVWGVDCQSRQGYKVSFVMTPGERREWVWRKTPSKPRQYGLIRAIIRAK